MEVPLLLGKHKETDISVSKTVLADAWQESKKLWYLAGPAILTAIFQYSLSSITQTFAGHIGTIELAAVGFGDMVISGIGFGVMLGMGSALETLCGQAFGAGQLHMLGIYMQRSWIILLFAALIITPIYIFATPILKLLGQSNAIALMGGRFSIYILPQLFAYALNFPIQKFLQSQSKVLAITWISGIAVIVHLFLSWFCIFDLDLGLAGAAIALDLSWWILVGGQLVYIFGGACSEAWTGFSWLAFKDLGGFIKLSIASAVMLCLEYWVLMVLIVLAGRLRNPEIAVDAISICMNLDGWFFMVPLGFMAAISIRVSNELGAGQPRAAKFSVLIVVLNTVVIGMVFMLLILATRKKFPVLFTDDWLVMKEVSRISGFLACSVILSGIQPVLSGVAIGAGWQTLIAYINVACYYLVGFPVGALMGFKFHFGLEASLAKERILNWGGSA